ncbi:MAG TPA: 16S rRNA (cytosine(1402)-N(4))-methyltransferase [Flavobacteriales bacterium]|jgi:16S rRNA (cytosine1402-N4)-methyltransferase|nr:16S rRNA (cytosine(1402)-N(4))-methyltransferase [Flavobacteriales bacterium]
MYHNPVLLQESVDGMNINEGGRYVDVTYGGGGHSKEILRRLNKGVLVAFDQDGDANNQLLDDDRLTFVKANFRYLRNHLLVLGVLPVQSVLADLGVSSHQIDNAERGFTFRSEAPLDMRMNQSSNLSAAEVLNEYESDELVRLFQNYGEIPNARKLADKIVQRRSEKLFATTFDLLALLDTDFKGRKKNYTARVFQALRIEVNRELEVLKDFLRSTEKCIAPGGRLVIITYHSLEDRLVKNYMRSGNFEGTLRKNFYGVIQRPFEPINRKVITPSEKELERNPRSRSAKLRIAERNDD